MPSHKNQHYVPRAYLKPFTLGGEGVSISLYNIDRRQVIPFAPVKNQCSRDYFYGEDRVVEKLMQPIEGKYGEVVERLTSRRAVLAQEDKEFLRSFWALQNLRTEASSRRVLAMTEGIRDVMRDVGGMPETTDKEAVQISMRSFAEARGTVEDLNVCLVKNRTKVPFVTSDDPAIVANRWYATDPRAAKLTFGLASAGAILILPMSPELCCVMYDGRVYRVDSEGGWVATKSERDIHALNQHAYLRARSNLYVRDQETWGAVVDGLAEVLERRDESKFHTSLAILANKKEPHGGYVRVDRPIVKGEEGIIHWWFYDAQPKIWPQFLRWRADGYVFSNGSMAGFLRKPTQKGTAFKKMKSRPLGQ